MSTTIQKFVTGNQFSFSDDPHATDYDAWAEKIKGNYGYFGRPEDVKYGAWTRSMTKGDYDDEGEFSWLAKPDRDGSGTPSPELWKGRTDAVRSAEGSPVRRYGYEEARQIGNNPHALTINKYRQEMMDLARDMPENGYELSLRDMVEAPRMTKSLEETVESKLEDKKKKKKYNKKGMRSMSRSESLDTGGPLLKMFIPRIPAAFGGRRQSFGKVSPTRPAPVDGEKRREGEWWSNSTSSSSSSGSSNSSRSSRILSSCYPFLGHKGKSMGTDE